MTPDRPVIRQSTGISCLAGYTPPSPRGVIDVRRRRAFRQAIIKLLATLRRRGRFTRHRMDSPLGVFPHTPLRSAVFRVPSAFIPAHELFTFPSKCPPQSKTVSGGFQREDNAHSDEEACLAAEIYPCLRMVLGSRAGWPTDRKCRGHVTIVIPRSGTYNQRPASPGHPT
jgi:hypothetical protein